MGEGDLLAKMQAQSQAMPVCAGTVPPEWQEDLFQTVRRNGNTVVPDLHHEIGVVGARAEAHGMIKVLPSAERSWLQTKQD